MANQLNFKIETEKSKLDLFEKLFGNRLNQNVKYYYGKSCMARKVKNQKINRCLITICFLTK